VSAARLAAVVAVCTGLLAPAAFAREQNLSPKALYQALLKIPKTPTALPAGYQSPALGPSPPSPVAKSHHVVGEVAIGLSKKGTDGARILYIIFPTRADALADWNHGTSALPRPRLPPPSSVPKPAAMFNAAAHPRNAAGKTLSVGTTTLAYVTGTIIVEIDTSSLATLKHGDPAAMPLLAQFAVAHLKSVETPAPPAGPIA
jgi:hypothetical protein